MPDHSKTCDVEGVLNENQGSCVTQHVAGLRVVEYLITFDQVLSNLPYAVNWNGRKQPEQTVAHLPKKNPAKIQIMARQGQTVALYLGSDASPEFRKEPLYSVTVGSNDIEVQITYVAGNTHSDQPAVGQPVKTNVKSDHGDLKDVYNAVLTGDIWMQFSHKYTLAEAQAYASAIGEVDVGLLAFLALVYGGQVAQSGARVVFANGQVCKITFQSDADKNCKEHIRTYAEQGGFSGACLPRVHPNTWLAFLRALRDNAIEAAEISSSWRPRTGSYGHRIGLGLDVTTITKDGRTRVLNNSNANLWGNEEEKQAHREWQDRTAEQQVAQREFDAAQKAADMASDGFDKKGSGRNWKKEQYPNWEAIDQREVRAKRAVSEANGRSESSKDKFNEKHKPTPLGAFENSLLAQVDLVKQVFSPFVMETEMGDKIAPSVNPDRSDRPAPVDSNEHLHRNHLHITATDAYLNPRLTKKK